MSVREWTTLAFRLAGLCFLVLALANTPMSVLLALEDYRANGHLATLGWSAFLVVLTMALSRWWARLRDGSGGAAELPRV